MEMLAILCLKVIPRGIPISKFESEEQIKTATKVGMKYKMLELGFMVNL